MVWVAVGAVAFIIFVAMFVSGGPQFEFIDKLQGKLKGDSGITTVYEPGHNIYILGVQEYFFPVRPDIVIKTMGSELTRKGWRENGLGDYGKGADWIVMTQLSRRRAAEFGFPNATCMVSIRRKPMWIVQQWHKVRLKLSPP
jgi:hypothetical protein